MVIHTPRLALRPVEQSDAPALLDAMRCPLVHQMHSDGFHSLAHVQRYIDVLIGEYAQGKFRTLGIAHKPEDKLIGMITIDEQAVFSRVELGYWIHLDWRNEGYSTEAVSAVVEDCFAKGRANRIQALTSNPASARVLEKAGLRYEGTLRQYLGKGNGFADVRMYAVLQGDCRAGAAQKNIP